MRFLLFEQITGAKTLRMFIFGITSVFVLSLGTRAVLTNAFFLEQRGRRVGACIGQSLLRAVTTSWTIKKRSKAVAVVQGSPFTV